MSSLHPCRQILFDVSDGERERLLLLCNAKKVALEIRRRALAVFEASIGTPNREIANVVGMSIPSVISWQWRYRYRKLDGLFSEKSTGRPKKSYLEDYCIRIGLKDRLGTRQPSIRRIAQDSPVSKSTIHRITKALGVMDTPAQWRRALRGDPVSLDQVIDITGVLLEPPEALLAVYCRPRVRVETRRMAISRGLLFGRINGHEIGPPLPLFRALERLQSPGDKKADDGNASERLSMFLGSLKDRFPAVQNTILVQCGMNVLSKNLLDPKLLAFCDHFPTCELNQRDWLNTLYRWLSLGAAWQREERPPSFTPYLREIEEDASERAIHSLSETYCRYQKVNCFEFIPKTLDEDKRDKIRRKLMQRHLGASFQGISDWSGPGGTWTMVQFAKVRNPNVHVYVRNVKKFLYADGKHAFSWVAECDKEWEGSDLRRSWL